MKKKKLLNFVLVLFPIIAFPQNFQKQKIDNLLSQINDKSNYVRLSEGEKMLLTTQLYDLSKEAGYKKGILISRIKQIQVYIAKADTNSALKLIAETLPLAKELNDNNNYAFLIEVKARALTFSKDFDEARGNFSAALQRSDFIKSNDTLHFRKVSIYTGLLDYALYAYQAFDKKAYKDSIIYFGNKAYQESQKIQAESFDKYVCIGQAAQCLGSAYVSLGELEKGERLLDEAETALKKSYYPLNIAALYAFRGDYEFKKNNYDKALEYFNKALEIGKKQNLPMVGINVYPILIEYYKKQGNTEKQLYYTEKNSALKDSLATINQYALITQKRIDKKPETLSRNSEWKWFIAGSLIILLGVAVSFYFMQKRKRLSDRSHFTGNRGLESEELTMLLDLAKNNDKQFFIVFQQTFPELYHRLLEFPELTPSDLELCAFLKLNLQTKEIATYKKTTVGAVDNRKYRLRKKLNLTEKINLYKWIDTL
ncbi:hypothetical protein BBH99_02570 [Chryseobacterium contaminans]|uniref:Uncharacterized protein n=1 Tax=Chryseobacterium contaminans TaxID=1423959 RepID=A0A1M7BFA7_9FLAO|nr:tetratricopeptide repeat protein [Chryseobacterium contaminans]OCA76616.1 hypothetical protein BBH99_02570 [Chryseobacterium contaminans]SHL53604.1 hypothetical protein SAMN05444407_104351 [Chryseobacterium contaminans]